MKNKTMGGGGGRGSLADSVDKRLSWVNSDQYLGVDGIEVVLE